GPAANDGDVAAFDAGRSIHDVRVHRHIMAWIPVSASVTRGRNRKVLTSGAFRSLTKKDAHRATRRQVMYTRPTAPRSIGGVLDDAIRLYRAAFSRCWVLALGGGVLS